MLTPVWVETSVSEIAKEAIEASTNPMGIDFELQRYTIYAGVRLQTKKNIPDKLIFLQKPPRKQTKAYFKFAYPMLHTAGGVVFTHQKRQTKMR